MRKKTILSVYEHVASVFAPLLKSNDKQSRLETQKSDDEQLDTGDMSELKGEESAAPEEQSAKGSKSLTLNQMLSRLPISLAQLNLGHNSDKLKDEIR